MSLSARDRIVFDTLIPSNGDPLLPRGVLELEFDTFFRDFEGPASPFIRRALRLALLSATWVAPLLIGARPPLGAHPQEVRERALEAMAASRIAILRQLVVLLKLVAALSYGGDAGVREAIGYSRGRHT